eukprot:GSMAST32.ASY1.ANO1.1659.1 assembled CDS
MNHTNQNLCERLINSDLRDQFLRKGEYSKNTQPITAGWLQSGDWKTARALASAHKFVVIDAEHGSMSLDAVALCIEVMAGNGCLSLVRVPFDSDTRKCYARRCLDAGAIGILFPNISTVEQARAAISNCYYPSKQGISGSRGFGYGGCNQDGAKFSEYANVANSKICIGVQLENKAAFEPETLEGIMALPGLVFTQDGPYDHSGSYHCPGNTSDERVVSDLIRYRKASKLYVFSMNFKFSEVYRDF